MTPKSIRLFGRYYLASGLIGLLAVMLNYSALRAYSVARGGAAASSLAGGMLGLLAALLFWYLIARRRQNWAKWVVVALAAVGLLGIIPAFVSGAYGGLPPFYLICSGFGEVVHLIAISYLFRCDAVQWLTDRANGEEPDVQAFD